ncbi:MAG: dTDP-4-dehydrorhamnose 3,5-epimerase family protein [Acetobacteraceae bacterium]
MFDVIETALPGVRLLRPTVRADSRGRFVKILHRDFFLAHGMAAEYAEQYYSVSAAGVVRGLHFQLPPHHHHKLVACLSGEVRDVVLDLRRASPGYGRHVAFELSGERGECVYIPAGCAHGFAVRSGPALLLYDVGSVHAPSHDSGLRWDSAGIDWGVTAPVVSPRDAALPGFDTFVSPF